MRLFPELILSDTNRRGGSASNEIVHRLHCWADFDWQNLTNNQRPPRRQSSTKAPTDPTDEPDVARALERSASHTMDGEISRGAAALDMATLGGTGEAEFRVLQGLTGEPPPYESKPIREGL